MTDQERNDLATVADALGFRVVQLSDERVAVLWERAGWAGGGPTVEAAVADFLHGAAQPALETAMRRPPIKTEREQLRAALQELYHQHSALLYSQTRDGSLAGEFEAEFRAKYGGLLD